MQTSLKIKFIKINGFTVNEKLLKATPNLPKATEKTIEILKEQLIKYFKEHNIEVKISHVMK